MFQILTYKITLLLLFTLALLLVNSSNSFENNYILFARKYEDTSNMNKNKQGAHFVNPPSDGGSSDSDDDINPREPEHPTPPQFKPKKRKKLPGNFHKFYKNKRRSYLKRNILTGVRTRVRLAKGGIVSSLPARRIRRRVQRQHSYLLALRRSRHTASLNFFTMLNINTRVLGRPPRARFIKMDEIINVYLNYDFSSLVLDDHMIPFLDRIRRQTDDPREWLETAFLSFIDFYEEFKVLLTFGSDPLNGIFAGDLEIFRTVLLTHDITP